MSCVKAGWKTVELIFLYGCISPDIQFPASDPVLGDDPGRRKLPDLGEARLLIEVEDGDPGAVTDEPEDQ